MFGVEPRVVISGCAARAEATVALYAPKAGGSGAFGTWWNSGWDLEELEAFEEQKEGACDHDSLNMEITSKGTAAKSFKGFWSCSYVAVYTHNTYTCTPKKRRTQSEVQQLLMMLYYDVYNTYIYIIILILYIYIAIHKHWTSDSNTTGAEMEVPEASFRSHCPMVPWPSTLHARRQ